jgi:hypothetical protein
VKKLPFPGQNAADAFGLELRIGCILHRSSGSIQPGRLR